MSYQAITAGEGQLLTLAYGEHIVAGHIIVNKTDGDRALLLALGEGVWDSCVALWYQGNKLPTDSFHFHPGTNSTGLTDPVQGVDTFYPQGITFSGTAYTAVRLPADYTEVEPTSVIGRYRTKIIEDYDASGNRLGASYSANPARIAADLMVEQSEIDPDRIDWPSWYAWKEYCDQVIHWDDGTDPNRLIPRFQAHVAFTGPTTLPAALNLLTELSASLWQDTGEKIVFLPVNQRSSIFTFGTSGADDVIVDGSVRVYSADTETLATYVRINFRDLDSEVLAPAQHEERNDEGLNQRGRVGLGDVELRAMHYSQAMRLARFYLNRAASTHLRCDLTAFGESFAVLPGDYAQIIHPAVGGTADAEVLEAEDLNDAEDRRRFTFALRRPVLYSDTDHQPIPTTVDVAV